MLGIFSLHAIRLTSIIESYFNHFLIGIYLVSGLCLLLWAVEADFLFSLCYDLDSLVNIMAAGKELFYINVDL